MIFAAVASAPDISKADEGGVSFWIPGFFGSLAAAPQQPGWSLTNMAYQTSVSAGGDVAIARERTLGNIPVNLNLSANLTASLSARADLDIFIATYVFKTPVLGGQASFNLLVSMGAWTLPLAHSFPARCRQLREEFRWAPPRFRASMPSTTPCGASETCFRSSHCAGTQASTTTWSTSPGTCRSEPTIPSRLSNIGIGHGTVDGGFGYTYLNPKTGQEFSGVLGFTYNMTNQQTQYQNGVDMHFDWGASQFLTKQFLVGLVGYAYDEVGCDSGSGDQVGCFQSRVFGVGPQVGFIIPSARRPRAISTSKATRNSTIATARTAGMPGSHSCSRQRNRRRARLQQRAA